MSQFENEIRKAFENFEGKADGNAWSEFEQTRGAASSGSFYKQFVVAGVVLVAAFGIISYNSDSGQHIAEHDNHITEELLADQIDAQIIENDDSIIEVITISAEEEDAEVASIAKVEEVPTNNLTKADKEALISLNRKIKRKTEEKLREKNEKKLVTEYVGKKFNLNASTHVSPNGDLKDDTFIPDGLKNSDDFILNIYDEFENIVFTTTSMKNPWKGLSNDGEELTFGDYKWKAIISKDNRSQIFNGRITLEE